MGASCYTIGTDGSLGLRGVGADGSACIYTGMGSGNHGRAKGGDGVASAMPDWAGKMPAL